MMTLLSRVLIKKATVADWAFLRQWKKKLFGFVRENAKPYDNLITRPDSSGMRVDVGGHDFGGIYRFLRERTYVKTREIVVYVRASISRTCIAGVLDWNSSESAASQFLSENEIWSRISRSRKDR